MDPKSPQSPLLTKAWDSLNFNFSSSLYRRRITNVLPNSTFVNLGISKRLSPLNIASPFCIKTPWLFTYVHLPEESVTPFLKSNFTSGRQPLESKYQQFLKF